MSLRLLSQRTGAERFKKPIPRGRGTGPSPRSSFRFWLPLLGIIPAISGCTLKQIAVRATAEVVQDAFAAFNEDE